MTQRIPDNVVEMLVNPTAPIAAQQAGIDLLSLRAAVRRVLDDIQKELDGDFLEPVHTLRCLRNILRAEMAGIDKDEGGKP